MILAYLALQKKSFPCLKIEYQCLKHKLVHQMNVCSCQLGTKKISSYIGLCTNLGDIFLGLLEIIYCL